MVKMINAWTKTEMFVAEDRVDEYKAAGCFLAAVSVTKEAESVKEEPKVEPKVEPKKAPVKKAPTKKVTKKATAKK